MTLVPTAQVTAEEPKVGVHVTVLPSMSVALMPRIVAVITPDVDTEIPETSLVGVGVPDKPIEAQASAARNVTVPPCS